MKIKYTLFALTILCLKQALAEPAEKKNVDNQAAAKEALADTAPVEGAVSLFDGKTLAGWTSSERDKKYFSVKDGEILGGSLEKPVPANVWLISEKSYENFELTFSVKFTDGGGPGLKNSGVQIRSLPIAEHVCGYQIDAGPTHPDKKVNAGLGYWGNIWDEHRRGPLVTAINQDKLTKSVKQWDDWNSYKVITKGTNIKTYINGILAHDYTEKNPKIAADGIIALQAHKGGKFLVHFKDLAIKELPATEGSPKWTDEGIIKGKQKKQPKKRQKKNK